MFQVFPARTWTFGSTCCTWQIVTKESQRSPCLSFSPEKSHNNFHTMFINDLTLPPDWRNLTGVSLLVEKLLTHLLWRDVASRPNTRPTNKTDVRHPARKKPIKRRLGNVLPHRMQTRRPRVNKAKMKAGVKKLRAEIAHIRGGNLNQVSSLDRTTAQDQGRRNMEKDTKNTG